MQAVVIHGREDYRLERVPVPVPGPGEALVRVEAVGICASDLKCFHGASMYWGDGPVPLADHYRRRHHRFSVPVAELPEPVEAGDDWDAELDRIVAESVMAKLPEQHRTVLALRYMDDCSVPECAELIGRTVHATEALLVRARRAFRAHYPEPEGGKS